MPRPFPTIDAETIQHPPCGEADLITAMIMLVLEDARSPNADLRRDVHKLVVLHRCAP